MPPSLGLSSVNLLARLTLRLFRIALRFLCLLAKAGQGLPRHVAGRKRRQRSSGSLKRVLSCASGIPVTYSLLGLSYRRLRGEHAPSRRSAVFIIFVVVVSDLF